MSAPAVSPVSAPPSLVRVKDGAITLRRASEMSGRRIAVISAAHPFLFCPGEAGPGMVKLFTDAAAFRAFCASPEASGHALSALFYDEKLVHAFFDPTNKGHHVRAVVAASRFFATGADPRRDEDGPGAAARHCALWQLIELEMELSRARLDLRFDLNSSARLALRQVAFHARAAEYLLSNDRRPL